MYKCCGMYRVTCRWSQRRVYIYMILTDVVKSSLGSYSLQQVGVRDQRNNESPPKFDPLPRFWFIVYTTDKSWGKHTISRVMRRIYVQIGSPKILFLGGIVCVCIFKCVWVQTEVCGIRFPSSTTPHFIYCDRVIGSGLCQFQFISWAYLWDSLFLPPKY